MPELPEVETIRRELAKKIRDKTISGVKINNAKVIKEPGVEAFRRGLKGEKIREIIRRGKVLILQFRPDKFLVIHLRISGWILYGDEAKTARVVFKLSDGKCLNYMNQRLLGELRLMRDYRDLKFIKELGPEPFELTLEEFKALLDGRKTKIKALLLEQKLIAGIGNIYAQEALFLARIDPRRTAASLTPAEIKKLYTEIVSVLKEAIANRGSSVDSYRNTQGESGGMEKRLKVYARKGKPCYVCGRPLQKISLGGRGTCFCAFCQK